MPRQQMKWVPRAVLFLLSLMALCSIETMADNSDDGETVEEEPTYTITNEVFFDVAIKETKDSEHTIRTERIVIGLFGDICPVRLGISYKK